MKFRSGWNSVPMAGGKIVYNANIVALPQQFLSAHGPYISGAACNQYASHSFLLKQA
jgi:hypothetical protein